VVIEIIEKEARRIVGLFAIAKTVRKAKFSAERPIRAL
jgi:hypothetical protein